MAKELVKKWHCQSTLSFLCKRGPYATAMFEQLKNASKPTET